MRHEILRLIVSNHVHYSFIQGPQLASFLLSLFLLVQCLIIQRRYNPKTEEMFFVNISQKFGLFCVYLPSKKCFMAIRYKSIILGYYVPSFFEMHIDTYKNDLTITGLSVKDQTILFHEYIHFLQDFTTYYGLSAIYAYSEYIHSVVNRIYTVKTSEFHVPFVIQDNNDNVLLNQQILRLTQGDSEECNNFAVTNVLQDKDPLLINPYMKEIPSVILNPNGDLRNFGALAIMESMAYILERLCSLAGVAKSPDYPYRSAELVAEHYNSKFGKNLMMVLALCDMSLQNSNPGACFVRVMKEIKENRIKFSTPEEVYDYFYDQELLDANGKTYLLLSGFKKLLKTVQSCMKSYLRDMPIVEEYYKWIDNLAHFAIDWRENDRYFLLRMARYPELAKNDCWGKAVHDVGTPLMSNNNEQYFKIPQAGAKLGMDVEYFKAIKQIVNLLEKGKVECNMFKWCSHSPNATPNEQCEKTPWLKISEERLCPYALLWKHWKLSDKKPIVK